MIATFDTDGNVWRSISIDADTGLCEVDVYVTQVTNERTEARFSCDPATADAIASALHVAAAQVRSARGERVEMELVESTTGIDRDYCTINGPTIDECETDYVLIHKADVPRLIAELGAWLAAHEVAK